MNGATAMPKARTLPDLLRWRAAVAPERRAYVFLRDGVDEGASFSYAGLDRAACAVAIALARMQPAARPGDRVLLLYPPGLDFLAAFFGCLYAGMIPVPAPPPDAARLKRTWPRLAAILADAGAACILSTAAIRDHARLAGVDELRWLCHEEIDANAADHCTPHACDASDPAYLQYTSGSTSSPKGVTLTHANVLHHLAALRTAWDYREDSVSVTWMPYFHDYGLVDGLLEPLYAGIPCHVLSPLTFVKRPQRWLEAIHRYRGTHTQAPNFAYELCLEKITPAQRDALDLASWRVASNGAEPVRASTLARFADYFAPCGLRAEALYPSYGLAEATLLVATKPHGALAMVAHLDAQALEREHRAAEAAGDRPAREVVSCGPPLAGTQVAIADAAGRRCADGAIGEIWVADPAVAAGYWQRVEESAATFGARLADAPDAGPFLRTGDLGFMRGGELFVTGRSKDLIIVAGANHYPQDIELTVQRAHAALRPDHCAAFAVEVDGEERLVVIAEANRALDDWQPLFDAVRGAVAETHELALHAFAILRKGGILKTSSGKLQRQACRQAWLDGRLEIVAQTRAQASAVRAAAAPAAEGARARIAAWLADALAARLGVPAAAIDPQARFAALGLTSRLGVQLVGELEQWLGRDDLSPTLLWEYPSVAALSAHLAGETEATARAAAPAAAQGGIAIVGMACRFPGADSPEAFWQLLKNKGEALRELPPGRWQGAGVEIRAGTGPGCVTTLRGGFLDAVDGFDAELFGIGRREAEIMDPQQRLLLETAWEAIERAGLDAARLAGSDAGVFVGISTDDYSAWQFADAAAISAYTGPAKALCIAANRISYQFDFTGPSLAIDTACSSSLVAIHEAAQALRRGECGLAMAGGVNLILAPQMSIALSQAGMLAPDGRCKTFDAAADGYVRGEGCALLVLKRLEDAERDGDRVLAVIRGSAVNQDGRSNGLTAPNGLAQQRVIAGALAAAGIEAADVGYVEAHGTGTALGDPIEVKSLQAVFGSQQGAAHRCALGAVKANIGHLEAAAGVAGVVKAVLALQHAEIPPHPTLREINPLIDLRGSPFHVPTEPTPWPGERRIAGVSSFGFGGTNAHLILEAAPMAAPAAAAPALERPLHLLMLGAHDEPALRALAARWCERLDAAAAGEAADLCFSAHTARSPQPQRLAAVGADTAELAAALRAWQQGQSARTWDGTTSARAPRIAFLFTGQGAQYAGMGVELYRSQPGFRRDIDECDALLRPLGVPLLELLYGAEGEAAETRLARTEFTQPALFAVEYALARLWLSWGVRPAALLGHSIGEYVAACVAGVFPLADALRLVAERGRRMQAAPGEGGMLAVGADEATLTTALAALPDHGVVIAAYNGPRHHVLAGGRAELARVAAELERQGIETQALKVSHAFHSPQMEPILDGFAAVAGRVAMAPPALPVHSNLDGRAAGDELARASYWVEQLRRPVRFADGVRALLADGIDAFVEIGPRPVLLALARETAGFDAAERLWLPSLRPRSGEHAQMLESLARLYVRGAPVDARGFDAPWPRRRRDVPIYPFQHRRYWLPARAPAAAAAAPAWPGRLTRSPLLDHALFENRYDRTGLPLLDEHRVFGELVVPGAAHLSLLADAAAVLAVAAPYELREIVFSQALVLPESGARRVQLAIAAHEDAAGRVFRLASLPDAAETPWHEHASGRLAASAPAVRAEPLSALQARCAEAAGGDFYAETWQAAIALGPRFRWVEAVFGGAGEVLARLRRPAEAADDAYRLHPGLLDSMLQILTAAVPVDADSALVPFRIDAFRVHGPAADETLWSHLRLRSDAGDAAEIVSDVRLYGADGGLRAEALGFRARRVSGRSLLRDRRLADALYAAAWRELAPGTAEAARPELVCRLDAIAAADPGEAAARVVEEALAAVRDALAASQRLVLVTRGAQAVAAGDAPRPAQAAAWGLARVIRLEHPELACRCVDLDPRGGAAVPAAPDEPELAVRSDRLYAPRLERLAVPEGTIALRADATYLISGGLGGLGLALAEWLVAQGARHLLLLGRRAPDAAAAARLAALEALGARVTALQADIATAGAWRQALEAATPPLAGVFHLAGVLDDGMLLQQDETRRRGVLAPKLGGAWALHEATAGMSLDRFICFSSAAAAIGSLGQGAYAAANAAVDALMAARRAGGLPGTSIQWGPWAEAGMAATPAQRERFADYGIDAVGIDAGMALLGRLLAAGRGECLVLPVQWPRYVERLHGGAVPALCRDLLAAPAAGATSAGLRALAAAPAAERRGLLEQELRAAVAGVLGLADARQIAPRQRLFELGLDSLGAVELRNRLAAALGKPLRATLLFDFPTLTALADHVERDVLGLSAAPTPGAAPAAEAAADLAQLSADELAELLAAELDA